ncbi:MAG: cytidine deaminase [Tidjanibacter sp.]|nr:cytidine deaminase [Tidjanibacter sp.]
MEKSLTLEFRHYDSIETLPADERELVIAAQLACNKAIAPYSNFHVGAAARLESGRIITGSNVESEVYPAGLCAERTLLYHHQASTPEDRIVALAIASNPSLRECYPCGQCRQVLHDVEKRQGLDFRVIMSGGGSATVVEKASDLLPFTFSL